MGVEFKESFNQHDVNHAIETAIMTSFVPRLKEMHDDPNNKDKDYQQLLKEALDGACFINSALAAAFLLENYQHLFDQMMLIEADAIGLKIGSFKRVAAANHAGLIMKDLHGDWHYITPANNPKPPRNVFLAAIKRRLGHKEDFPLLTHLREKSLKKIIKSIEILESNRKKHNLYPTEDEINQAILSANLSELIQTRPNQDSIIHVIKKDGERSGVKILAKKYDLKEEKQKLASMEN